MYHFLTAGTVLFGSSAIALTVGFSYSFTQMRKKHMVDINDEVVRSFFSLHYVVCSTICRRKKQCVGQGEH